MYLGRIFINILAGNAKISTLCASFKNYEYATL